MTFDFGLLAQLALAAINADEQLMRGSAPRRNLVVSVPCCRVVILFRGVTLGANLVEAKGTTVIIRQAENDVSPSCPPLLPVFPVHMFRFRYLREMSRK